MSKLEKAYFKRVLKEIAAIKVMMFVILLFNFMLTATLLYFIFIL